MINVQETYKNLTIWFPARVNKKIQLHYIQCVLLSAFKLGTAKTMIEIFEENKTNHKVRRMAPTKSIDEFNPFSEESPATFDHFLEPIQDGKFFSAFDQTSFISSTTMETITPDTDEMLNVRCYIDKDQIKRLLKENKKTKENTKEGFLKAALDKEFYMVLSLVNSDPPPKSLSLAKFLKHLNDFKIAVFYTKNIDQTFDIYNVGVYLNHTNFDVNIFKTGNKKEELAIFSVTAEETKIFWGASRMLQ
jgi:hypothetical protein